MDLPVSSIQSHLIIYLPDDISVSVFLCQGALLPVLCSVWWPSVSPHLSAVLLSPLMDLQSSSSLIVMVSVSLSLSALPPLSSHFFKGHREVASSLRPTRKLPLIRNLFPLLYLFPRLSPRHLIIYIPRTFSSTVHFSRSCCKHPENGGRKPQRCKYLFHRAGETY